ncbi:MAG: hypothetical protein KC912_18780 [Proteobacteria bacterium]|nr:hypothetical protein [Pseudomonadota bacterium]
MSLFDLELSSSVTTSVPIEVVRATFEDTASWPAWCSAVVSVDAVPSAWKSGERLSYVLSSLSEVAFDVRLTVVDPSQIAWTSRKGPIVGTRTWRFDTDERGTHITDTKLFQSTWLPLRLLYPRPVIRRMSAQWLADLVAEATRRSA